MARWHEYLKEGRGHTLSMQNISGDGIQRRYFEQAKAAYIKAICASLHDEQREYKTAWEALGHLYLERSNQERNKEFQLKLWHNAALALARMLYIDKRGNGTVDQDTRMKLEILEKKPGNMVVFEDIIGLTTEPLRRYVEKHGRYPDIAQVYAHGIEDIPTDVVF